VAAKLDQISAFTVDTVSELRDTIWAMNKDHVSLEDLESRILNFVGKAKDSCPQIVFHLEISDKLRKTHYFNSLEGVNYFRVAQEAINNAIKHSNASVVEVRIDQESDSIRLSVIDNGKGFGQMPAGNGLGTMRNRAERIGKTLSITSLDNQGTQVSIS
jgi:signal transduction histidine kinase